jgi:ascorbate-specific PTS system EIIC-type component UlaA
MPEGTTSVVTWSTEQKILQSFHDRIATEVITVFSVFVVPCIFKYSNKTPNQMQQSVVKFIA